MPRMHRHRPLCLIDIWWLQGESTRMVPSMPSPSRLQRSRTSSLVKRFNRAPFAWLVACAFSSDCSSMPAVQHEPVPKSRVARLSAVRCAGAISLGNQLSPPRGYRSRESEVGSTYQAGHRRLGRWISATRAINSGPETVVSRLRITAASRMSASTPVDFGLVETGRSAGLIVQGEFIDTALDCQAKITLGSLFVAKTALRMTAS